MPVFSVRTRLIAVITVVAALGMLAVGFVVYLEERAASSSRSTDCWMRTSSPPGTWSSRATATPARGAAPSRLWVQSCNAPRPIASTSAVGIIDGVARLVPGVPLDVDLLQHPGLRSLCRRGHVRR